MDAEEQAANSGSRSASSSTSSFSPSKQIPRRWSARVTRKQVSQAISATSPLEGSGSVCHSRTPPSVSTKTPSVAATWRCTLRLATEPNRWVHEIMPGCACLTLPTPHRDVLCSPAPAPSHTRREARRSRASREADRRAGAPVARPVSRPSARRRPKADPVERPTPRAQRAGARPQKNEPLATGYRWGKESTRVDAAQPGPTVALGTSATLDSLGCDRRARYRGVLAAAAGHPVTL